MGELRSTVLLSFGVKSRVQIRFRFVYNKQEPLDVSKVNPAFQCIKELHRLSLLVNFGGVN